MAKKEARSIGELTYEEAFAELESIVTALESGDQPLDATLAFYERGQLLSKRCAELLDKAELQVQKLSTDKLEPFEAGG
jgi:exodeoxyribonuclease VII small subunit